MDMMEDVADAVAEAARMAIVVAVATIAAADYENIYIVDSTSAAMGSGILVELAFRLLDEGKSAGEIAATLEEEKKKIVVVAFGRHP